MEDVTLLDIIDAYPEEIDHWFKTVPIRSLKDAFRLSIFKWWYMDYVERKGDDETKESARKLIGSKWTTCGLCRWTVGRLEDCSKCPIGKEFEDYACFKEWELWNRGEAPARKVVERLIKEYCKLFGEEKDED